jgi:hypothetical protein
MTVSFFAAYQNFKYHFFCLQDSDFEVKVSTGMFNFFGNGCWTHRKVADELSNYPETIPVTYSATKKLLG